MRKSTMTKEDFKALREILGLSATDFAYKLGISASTVWAYESGKRMIPEIITNTAKSMTTARIGSKVE